MSVHIVLHHEPSLAEETVLEIDWVEVEDDDDDLDFNPVDPGLSPYRKQRKVRKVRKIKVTIVEE